MIGDALRLIRKFHDLSQSELAAAIDVSNTYISELERNNREPSLSVVHKYAEFFDIPASSILFFAENLDDRSPRARANRAVSKKILALMEFLSQKSTKIS